MKITAVDIAKIAAAHFGVPTTDILSIMKVPTSPATLRDEFAGKAMQAILSEDPDYHQKYKFIDLADFSYQCADAMLTAREL